MPAFFFFFLAFRDITYIISLQTKLYEIYNKSTKSSYCGAHR